jgi:hypothetical protein
MAAVAAAGTWQPVPRAKLCVVLYDQGMTQEPLPSLRRVSRVLLLILTHCFLDSLSRLQTKVMVSAPGCISSKLL